jgi:pimeloyl-ACP methyl ester carboxylesterase
MTGTGPGAIALLLACAALEGCASPGATGRGAYADVNGLHMYYEVHGTGRPLVLIHGGGSTIGTTFGKVLPALAHSRQVIAVELQGHGHTADIDRPLTFEQDADDVAALLRQLSVPQADVYGYSNGATTAMQLAVRHPELVRRLVLASAFFRNDGLRPEVHDLFQAPADPNDMPPVLREAFLAVAPKPEQLPAIVDKEITRMRGYRDWTPEMIRSIKAPTLLIFGDSDIVRPDYPAEMQRELPGSQLAVLPGTDHMAVVGRAGVLLEIIPAFLDAPEVAGAAGE